MSWQSFQSRQSAIPEPLYEGMPGHLAPQVWQWLSSYIIPDGNYSTKRIRDVALLARIPLTVNARSSRIHSDLIEQCMNDPNAFLAALDATLALQGASSSSTTDSLRNLLAVGRSAWTLSPDGLALSRVVDPVAEEAAKKAMSPADSASEELREAWKNAYGVSIDPSDSWDHSIKACEHILQPIVCPRNAKATLGNIIGDLRSQGHLWHLTLPGKDENHNVDKLVSMLDLLWPNPDRHGGPHNRGVTSEEGQAVVHLAVTVVQWARSGVLTKKS